MFTLALIASALLHAGAIGFIHFTPPDLTLFQDKMPALDIVLVNAKTKEAPQQADALAQANLDRGGNTEEKRKAKTALPPPRNKPQQTTARPDETVTLAARRDQVEAEAARQDQRVAELERQTRELMTQLKSGPTVDDRPGGQQQTPPQPKQDQDQNTAAPVIDRAALATTVADIARLEAQIAKQQDEYQKRPKRKFIGARTQEYRFATYVESWRQKVERIGNLNYPEAAKDQKLYGQLRMTVSIKADGAIEKIELNKSSGYAILDEAARRIVELAAPYAPFPEDIRRDTDILSITRTWTFTRQDSFATD